MEHAAPLTPVRDPSFNLAMVQDSPFSDYFTDDARSSDQQTKPKFNMPSNETQRLLLRLNDLGSQILRHDPSTSTINTLSDRLDALEHTLTAPDTQTRQPADLVDSGLFMEDDAQTPHEYGLDMSSSSLPFALDGASDALTTRLKEAAANNGDGDKNADLIKESQDLLERVTRANTDLQARFEEMRKLNDEHISQIEECTREVLTLRSETEVLKADLGFDHTELLFLKLQLKALEVQADGLADAQYDGSEEERQKRVLLLDDMEKWKADWDDVDARLRGRREKHSVISSSPEKRMRSAREDCKDADEEGAWKLDFCKKRQGRVSSITIKRLDMLGLDGAKDEDETMQVKPESEGSGRQAGTEEGTRTMHFGVDDAISDEDANQEDDEDEEEKPPAKTPWQELCEGLAALAGVKSQ